MNLFFYPDDSEILETWILISSFKYFRVIRIEKQISTFVFWKNFWLKDFVSRSTDLQVRRLNIEMTMSIDNKTLNDQSFRLIKYKNVLKTEMSNRYLVRIRITNQTLFLEVKQILVVGLYLQNGQASLLIACWDKNVSLLNTKKKSNSEGYLMNND